MSEEIVPLELIESQAGVELANKKLGITQTDYIKIEPKEKEVIDKVFDAGLKHLYKVAPEIARDIERQKKLVYVAAGVAKAKMPTTKSYAFPSMSGNLGVAWLIPQALKYVATASSDNPAFTSYKTNLWEMDLTAGTAAWILGDGTNYYKTSSATNKHAVILIFENGLLEYGSTPVAEQFKLISEASSKVGIYTVEPLVEIPVSDEKAIYQYPTPLGALILDWDMGFMWGFMPKYSGTHKLPLLGMVFYEHDFLADLTWVA